jgi:N12 class adenine-specific DNA methylase
MVEKITQMTAEDELKNLTPEIQFDAIMLFLSPDARVKANWQLEVLGNVYFHIGMTERGPGFIELMNPDVVHIKLDEKTRVMNNMDADRMEHLTSFEAEKEALIEEFEAKIENLQEIANVQDSVINSLVVDKSETFKALSKCTKERDEWRERFETAMKQAEEK